VKILLICGGVIAALAGVAVIVGYLLPVNHTVSRSILLRASKDQVWALISDFERYPSWRPDLKSVEKLHDTGGHPMWRETSRSNETIEYETIEAEPGKKLVQRVATQGLPFGGTWTLQLAQDRGNTTLTITENGQVYNPVFRFISRFIVGQTVNIERYLNDVKSALGEA